MGIKRTLIMVKEGDQYVANREVTGYSAGAMEEAVADLKTGTGVATRQYFLREEEDGKLVSEVPFKEGIKQLKDEAKAEAKAEAAAEVAEKAEEAPKDNKAATKKAASTKASTKPTK
jgi:pyruvate/2-oxoglutarate dehydrogenase complex dihydrolipoamide acyltransferase (E2) component